MVKKPKPGQPDNPIVIIEDLIVPPSGPHGAVNPNDYSMVQQFELGWLLDPGYQRLLDNLAASPGAFKTVRVMKVFTNNIATVTTSRPAGANETGIDGTASNGNVWPAGQPIDLTGTLNGLYELTKRKLIPFVVLGFFPPGIYTGTSSAISPTGPTGPSALPSPADLTNSDWQQIVQNWKTLVTAFLTALHNDSRFSPTLSQWWFEVWNEPDNPGFWIPDNPYNSIGGPLTYYQALYQATSEAVIATTYTIRLGGPAIMGTSVPSAGASLMLPFITFVMTIDPATSKPQKCDFLSFHGKGEWDFCLNGNPDFQSVVAAAETTAQWAKTAGLTSVKIVNDEADMRANFAAPFKPRMTEQYPAWLTALLIAYDSLSSEYGPIEFMTGSDNADLQLVGYLQKSIMQKETGVPPPAPYAPALLTETFNAAAFGQQRSIMTAASSKMNSSVWSETNCPLDLLKVPVYNFYELLRLLGDQHGTFVTGSNNYYPNKSDLFHMITFDAARIGSVFCVYPFPGGPAKTAWSLNYSIEGISSTWKLINWYQFQIDGSLSNGFTQAGGPTKEPDAAFCVPDPRITKPTPQVFPNTFIPLPLSATDVAAIRQHQELAVVASKTGVVAPGGVFNIELSIPAYTTTVLWITENTSKPPAKPATPTHVLDVTDYGTNVVLFWTPDPDPTVYSYEVHRDEKLVSPTPLRAALWVDTNPGKGRTYTYYLITRSASGTPSVQSTSISVRIPP